MKTRNCVMTIAIPHADNGIYRMSMKTVKNYAEKIGCDLVVCSEKKYSKKLGFDHVFAEKIQIRDTLENYERVLFFDLDTLVLPETVNLFDLFPDPGVVAFSVGHWPWNHEGVEFCWDKLGLNFYEAQNGYPYLMNTGVIIHDQSSRDVFTRLFEMYEDKKHFEYYNQNGHFEQTATSAFVCELKVPFTELPFKYNHCCYGGFEIYRSRLQAAILHYAGGDRYWEEVGAKYPRDIQMELDYKELEKQYRL